MASNTPNLGLLKKNTLTDGSDTFNVKTMMNDNWDKVDGAVGDLGAVMPTLGLPSTASVAEGLLSISPPLIAKYETAGAYTWVAPDLFKGKSYRIGVVVVGGGGSGGLTFEIPQGSAFNGIVYGGTCGAAVSIDAVVTPLTSHAIVVGKGGDSVTANQPTPGYNNTGEAGNNGSTSSFDSITAYGGYKGFAMYSSNLGAPPSIPCNEYGVFGAYKSDALNGNYVWLFAVDRFFIKNILGSSNFNRIDKNTGVITEAGVAGVDPFSGLGAGACVGVNGNYAKAYDATLPGCGGGSASISAYTGTAISGKGGDGAVYIYFLGVV